MQPEKPAQVQPWQASDFAEKVIAYYHEFGRKDLPWHQSSDAYPIWLSEIMLQQTQVATVIPYYQRFLKSFPTVADLAQASDDDVMNHWSGLGYYNRARNLHKTAKIVHIDFNNQFPQSVDKLVELPGIGRSTAGSIAAFSFNQPSAILDGNVKRVLARCYAIDGWPGKGSVLKSLWEVAENNTPTHETGNYNQAMMDLGATVCTRSKPKCSMCPLSQHCMALHSDNIAQYPGKKPKKIRPKKSVYWLLQIDQKQSAVFLTKRPQTGIWGGLWSIPEIAIEDNEAPPKTFAHKALDAIEHKFSHYDLTIYPLLSTANETSAIAEQSTLYKLDNSGQWFTRKQLSSIGLPAPVEKLLQTLI